MSYEFLDNLKSLFFENKTLRQTVFKNTFWLILAEAIESVVSFAVIVWLARYLGPEEYGQWTFVMSFIAIFAAFCDIGLSVVAVRRIARDNSKTGEVIDNILFIKFILSIFIFIIIIASSFFLGNRGDSILIYILAGYTIINNFNIFFRTVFQGNQKMQYESVVRISQSLILIASMGLFMFFRLSAASMGSAYLISAIFGTVISLFFIQKYFSKFFLKINLKTCKEIFFDALPLGLGSIAIIIYYCIGPVMLGFMRSNIEVGWYGASYKIAIAAQTLVGVFVAIFFPDFSKKFHKDKQLLRSSLEDFLKIMHFFAWPIAIGGSVLATRILVFLYGSNYISGFFCLQMLLWTTAVIYIASPYHELMKATDQQKNYFRIVAVGAVFNILINIPCILFFGMNGVALALFLTEIMIVIITFTYVKKIVDLGATSFFIKPLLASIVMLIPIYFLYYKFNVVALIILGAVTYLLTYFFITKLVSFLLKGIDFLFKVINIIPFILRHTDKESQKAFVKIVLFKLFSVFGFKIIDAEYFLNVKYNFLKGDNIEYVFNDKNFVFSFSKNKDEKINQAFSHVVEEIFINRVYEQAGVTIDNGDIVFDCGANVGMFSAYAADCVGNGGKVFAFEPGMEEFNFLISNVKKNHLENVNPFCFAIGKEDNKGMLFLDKESLGNRIVDKKKEGQSGEEILEIEIKSIDSFIAKNNIAKVDFIKMDIEGFERDALLGAKNIIQTFKPKLAICAYHKRDDFFELPVLIKKLNNEYEIKIRNVKNTLMVFAK